MAATKSRVVTDQFGNLEMIIHPDTDEQLDTVPQFSPPGSLTVDLLKVDYDGVKRPRDLLALLQPTLNEKNRIAGILCEAKIEAIDVAQAIEADVIAAKEKLAEAVELGVPIGSAKL